MPLYLLNRGFEMGESAWITAALSAPSPGGKMGAPRYSVAHSRIFASSVLMEPFAGAPEGFAGGRFGPSRVRVVARGVSSRVARRGRLGAFLGATLRARVQDRNDASSTSNDVQWARACFGCARSGAVPPGDGGTRLALRAG